MGTRKDVVQIADGDHNLYVLGYDNIVAQAKITWGVITREYSCVCCIHSTICTEQFVWKLE